MVMSVDRGDGAACGDGAERGAAAASGWPMAASGGGCTASAGSMPRTDPRMRYCASTSRFSGLSPSAARPSSQPSALIIARKTSCSVASMALRSLRSPMCPIAGFAQALREAPAALDLRRGHAVGHADGGHDGVLGFGQRDALALGLRILRGPVEASGLACRAGDLGLRSGPELACWDEPLMDDRSR